MNKENALLNEEPKKQVKKYRYFETKLYPDEDPKHEAMLIHLRTYHDVIHITHDKDFTYDDNNELVLDEEGKPIPIKPHTHIVWYSIQPTTEHKFVKFYKNWTNLSISGVSDIHAFLMYMLHDTPDSQHKARYTYECFETNAYDRYMNMLNKALILPKYAEYIDILSDLYCGTYNAMEIASKVMSSGNHDFYMFWKQNQSFINQSIRDKQFHFKYMSGVKDER